MKTKLFTGVAFAAMMIPGAAFAQSTGSQDFDQGDVVVTAARPNKGIAGVQIPDSPKAKGVLTQEFIARQTPGNTILDTINLLPGVSFQNNDPFGSAGGTLTIRGFDSSRISLTFDGVPLNDTGNYAVYSNQQLDPELIEQVNVNYGSTDVDSPTAAASGSTVNYRTIVPTDKFGVRVVGSVGDYNFFRVFGVVNTGVFTSFGTKAWVSASSANNNVVFNDFGKINKSQYNARIYQPIGSNGDFISLSGNYNVNRNNFFGSAPLRIDNTISPTNLTPRTPGTGSSNRFPISRSELPYHVARCQVASATYGVADSTNSCGTSFDERYNPSNTGNIRFGSKFTLAPSLVLTVDASFQYVKANGGGTVTGKEQTKTVGGVAYQGFIGGSYYFGRDLNGDGDTLDSVIELAPSQTVTHRYGLLSTLRYDIDDNNTVRINYSHDYGRHRQTGELAPLLANGFPTDVFPINSPLHAANGTIVEKRDRLSFATLDQVSGEYRGKFGGLTVNLGVRAPWFKRDLTNYCFTTSASGFVDCLGIGNTAANTTYATTNPGYAAPQQRVYKYNRVLPNAGLTYRFANSFSAYFNYSKGLQVPGTDNLYNAFYFARNSPSANPTPETSDNFDAGIRYTTSTVQAVLSPWYTRFTNRLASAYDPDSQTTTYRNLGRVDKYGIDASVSWRPIPEVTAYVFGSYLKSEIKNNVSLGTCTTTTTANCTTIGAPIYALTAGKRESGSPTYTFGGRLAGSFGPVDLAIQAKRTGPRYLNDQNLPNLQCTSTVVNSACPTTATSYQVYPAKTPAYTQVDLDARLKMGWAGLNDTTYLQVNVQNLFNEYYVGGFSGGATTQYSVPFAQIGSPRAFIASLNVQF
ncbi:MAG: TonB-dependent receptor [Sphingomonas sp.]|uniref:TonB-dependent receptor n=1 Tax=Sphingomonas sp. TaxID=28214 RepID=UPI00356881E8